MYCARSVLEIRHLLTEEIGHLAAGNDLGLTLRAMRAQCRRFLNAFDGNPRRGHGHSDPFGDDPLSQSLGELRDVFGIHIPQLAIHYDIELEDELAAIVPPKPEDTDADDGPGKSKRARRAREQD